MKKSLGLYDIVLMNVTAIIGLRWITIAAAGGASSVFMWIFAAFMFFVPLGLVSSELATGWPKQGGLYVWVKEAFGDKPAFITSWFYWINNLFYYPSLLAFIAVTLAFLIDPLLVQHGLLTGNATLADSKLYVCGLTLVLFWLLTFINCKGIRIGKWLANLSGLFGTIMPGLTIIVLGAASVFLLKRPIPTDYSFDKLIPSLSSFSDISFLSTLMFAMAGIELTPTLAGDTENPEKTFPRATLISAVIIAIIYIIGTVAMTMILSPDKIGSASGIMAAMKLLSSELNFPFLLTGMAIMITLGNFGGVGVWIIGPIKMLFESTRQGVFPEFFVRLNDDGMPRNAMIVQAFLITLITLCTSFMPSVESMYEVLILMTTITYFIPYILLFGAFIKLRKSHPDTPRPYRVPGGNPGAWLVAGIGLFSVMLGIFLPFVPGKDLTTVQAITIYELEIAGGPLLFGLAGFLLYRRFERKSLAPDV